MTRKGRPSKDTSQIGLRLENSTLVRLEGICLELGMSKSAFIEKLIKGYQNSDTNHSR